MTVDSNRIQKDYYEGNNYGDYQFTSLDDIINQFMVVYVGEEKIVSKANKVDVAFHAQRALQELSFDTFKSIKSQEIVLPPSLKMILPHDYVNYTQVSWSDDSGIKRPLYPTKHTSNPFSILQDEDGFYDFPDELELLSDPSFTKSVLPVRWSRTSLNKKTKDPATYPDTLKIGYYNGDPISYSYGFNYTGGTKIKPSNGALEFRHASTPTKRSNIANADPLFDGNGVVYSGQVLAVWHRINVKNMDFLDFGATVNVATSTHADQSAGNVVVAIQEKPGKNNIKDRGTKSQERTPGWLSKNLKVKQLALAYLEWDASDAGSDVTKSMNLDVKDYDTLYFIITSRVEFVGAADFAAVYPATPSATTPIKNLIKSVTCKNTIPPDELQQRNHTTKDSSTWEKYQSNSTSENTNTNNDYDTDIYDLNRGQRFGLNPNKSQVNGSFYIDNLQGFINFSSNISGKTVILDYISDSLGTDGEMQVHKFAQEAMYKSIMYAILSTRANTPEYIVRRYKQEKFAATRQAKLRLSNIKLEEITQILRGKSKWIKH
jgi:hypothetical protein